MADFDWKHPAYAPVWAERVARLQRLRADPGLLSGLMAFYADHPVEFISDWCCTFDPRNVERGIEAVTPFLLFRMDRFYTSATGPHVTGHKDGLFTYPRTCIGLP